MKKALLFLRASLEAAPSPSRLCSYGHAPLRTVSFFETRDMERMLSFRCRDVSLQPDQPHVSPYLILGCTLQPSYQTAIYAPRLVRCRISGSFFNLHIMRGENLYGYEAEVPEVQHLCKRTVFIFCTAPFFERLAPWPLNSTSTFFTFRPRLQ